METYQIPDPFWLSDKYIFKQYKFEEDRPVSTIYVKINSINKIEEIGVDIASRMHMDNKSFDELTKLKFVEKATRLQKSIINRIGSEYWWEIYNIK
jgi:hypothetical protein